MTTYSLIILTLLAAAPWLTTPIPAIIEAKREGLAAAGKPLLLWAIPVNFVYSVMALIGSMTLGPALQFALVSAIAAGFVYFIAGATIKIAHL